jgi:hypothetical protein
MYHLLWAGNLLMVEPDRGKEEKGIGEEQRGIWGKEEENNDSSDECFRR